ncbi:hypothetical protein [Delftia phage PhiW-14]|uniref:Uncharacterized protein n=1 Tax=Delftia phage PhiW-14 TaxID=665032 RepID=C9DGE9_BPW14|nr:hypothetical protein DP-phiW-14_gp179 [Delftia phage PhiW-14]ACV50200.1 hypothetical protein [Delftia phage PhiW-14]
MTKYTVVEINTNDTTQRRVAVLEGTLQEVMERAASRSHWVMGDLKLFAPGDVLVAHKQWRDQQWTFIFNVHERLGDEQQHESQIECSSLTEAKEMVQGDHKWLFGDLMIKDATGKTLSSMKWTDNEWSDAA